MKTKVGTQLKKKEKDNCVQVAVPQLAPLSRMDQDREPEKRQQQKQ